MILATDAAGVNLRIRFLVSAVLFYAAGRWRARVVGAPELASEGDQELVPATRAAYTGDALSCRQV